MKRNERCLCESSKVLIFSCSGGSNVGLLSNQAAVELTKSGKARLVCLAGIGAHLSGMIESAKAGDLIVSINGCPVKCTDKTLEHADLKPDVSLIITDLGIEKSHDLTIEEDDCKLVADKVGEEISACLKLKPGYNGFQKTKESAGA